MADKNPKKAGDGGVIVFDTETKFSFMMSVNNQSANGVAQNRATACFSNSDEPIGGIPITYEITQGNAVFAGGLKEVQTRMNALDCDSISFTDTTAEKGKIRATLTLNRTNTQEIEYSFLASVSPSILTLTVTQNNALANGTAANSVTALVTLDGKPAAGKKINFTLSGSTTARFAGGVATTLSVITGTDGKAVVFIVNSSQKDEAVTLTGIVDENILVSQSVVVNFKGLAPAQAPVFILDTEKGSALSNGTDYAQVRAFISPAAGSPAQTYRVEFTVRKNYPVNPGNFTIGAPRGTHPSAQYSTTVNVNGVSAADAWIYNSDINASADAVALVTALLIDASGRVVATSNELPLVFKKGTTAPGGTLDGIVIDILDQEGGRNVRVANGVNYYACLFDITSNGAPYNGVFTVSITPQSSSYLTFYNFTDPTKRTTITSTRSGFASSNSIAPNFRNYMGVVVRDTSSQSLASIVTVTVISDGRTYSKSLGFPWSSAASPITVLPTPAAWPITVQIGDAERTYGPTNPISNNYYRCSLHIIPNSVPDQTFTISITPNNQNFMLGDAAGRLASSIPAYPQQTFFLGILKNQPADLSATLEIRAARGVVWRGIVYPRSLRLTIIN